MTTREAQQAPQAGPGGWTGGIIDADVHVNVPSIEVLFPYLEAPWIEFVRETGFAAPISPPTLYPPGAVTTVRHDWIPADGRVAASDYDLLRQHVLEPTSPERVILNCWWGVESVRHPEFGQGLARAVNDWVIAEFLDRDDRLRASITVPGHEPTAAAREIDRVGGHPGFVQVLLPVRSSRLLGNRIWYPMFDAIIRNNLVAGVHYGGQPDGPPTPTGWPSWFVEEHAGIIQVFFAQLTSLIAEGTFEKYPSLRLAFLEGGFTWLPSYMWRLDKEWKGLRRDIPWVKQAPSKTIREHIKLSTAPLDSGPPEQFAKVVGWLGSDELLMFASDYPHGHEDDLSTLLGALSPSAQTKLMADNARTHYGL
jgi:predicted TIM-barrel fold metal-dependent hydrolase